MRPGQPDPSDHSDPNLNEPSDSPIAIPDFAREWESLAQVASSVRRPSSLPDSDSFHEAIEVEVIFELDERMKDGSIETLLVVPVGCQRCKSSQVFCTRARPACMRCIRAGTNCVPLKKGYQKLPGPKVVKSGARKRKTSATCREQSKASSSAVHGPTKARLRPRLQRAASLPEVQPQYADSVSEWSDTPRSKRRSLSPDSDFTPPPKKKQASSISRTKKSRSNHKGALSKGVPTGCYRASEAGPSMQQASTVVSSAERSVLGWTFVKTPRVRGEQSCLGQECLPSMPASARIPRVWTNSLAGLLVAFPELTKAPAGFSCIQSGAPLLLLGANDDQGRWINTTTLSINMSWDFVCYESELEPIVESNVGASTQLHSSEGTLAGEIEMTDLEPLTPCSSLETEVVLATAVSPHVSTFDTQMLPSGGTPQQEPHRCQDVYESHSRSRSPTHDAAVDDLASADDQILRHPFDPPLPTDNPSLSHPPPLSDEALADNTGFRVDSRPRLPINNPPEVETLLNSQKCLIPLLLWMPHDSRLVPSSLPAEYAYLCMGFFFVSDLRHAVVQYDGPSSTGIVQGRVCWSVTLHWAPGGEDALFDCHPAISSDMTVDSAQPEITRDLLHPWWFDPTNMPSQTDETNILHGQTDLRMQFYSFLPLDLIAEFHPSEAFPRGWFCKSCGMINIQLFFRHQICQSNVCESMREKRVPQGKVEPLTNCRSIYQSSTLVRPATRIPSEVVSHWVIWDDGMQSWVHRVRDGVFLCHIFTGNQEHLQEDATALLEKIQAEALLYQENSSGPYFTHTTRLSHLNDASEAKVPEGTPDCVRTAYYTLCDLALRYGELEKPRFGEVRLQAWVISGSRRGGVFRASKCPVVIHSLGADVVLNFTPRGGYKDAVELAVSDKGKGRAEVPDRSGTPPTEPHAGSLHPLSLDGGDDSPFIPGPEASESLVVAENVASASATAAMGTLGSDDAGISNSTTPPLGLGTTFVRQEPGEPKPKGTRKKRKDAKDKTEPSIPEISMTLVHGDCIMLCGDDFECQIGRTGTTILVIGFPEETINH